MSDKNKIIYNDYKQNENNEQVEGRNSDTNLLNQNTLEHIDSEVQFKP